MKNLLNRLFLFGVLGSLVVLYSCGGDEVEPVETANPVITVVAERNGSEGNLVQDGNTVTVQSGTVVDMTITVNAEGGFNTLNVNGLFTSSTGADSIAQINRNDLNLAVGSTNAVIELDPIRIGGSGTTTFTVSAIDEDNRTTTETITLIITSPDAVVRPSQFLLVPGANGETQTFYSVNQNRTYSSDDVTGTAEAVSPNIDFGYYYGVNNEATLASPASYPSNVFDISGWGTRNSTPMIMTTLTAEVVNSYATEADVDGAYDNLDDSNPSQQLTNLSAGTVIAFRTANKTDADGTFYQRGFITVLSIEEGDSPAANDGITIRLVLGSRVDVN